MKPHTLLLAILPLVIFSARAQEAATPNAMPIHASKIILVGDSTMQVHSGWGGSFCAQHVTSLAACVNLARGGRSSKSYREEGSWELALAEMKTPGFVNTWVLIQFGHNDQPGKPGRSTDLATEFPANMRHYIDDVRAAGAQPILLTPLTRRKFKNAQLQNDLVAWAAATIEVASELKVPLIDLNAKSAAAVQAMGPAAANEFAELAPSAEVVAAAKNGTSIDAATSALTATSVSASSEKSILPPMAKVNLTFDYTHLGAKGADYFSKMVTDELALQVPSMRPLLIP